MGSDKGMGEATFSTDAEACGVSDLWVVANAWQMHGPGRSMASKDAWADAWRLVALSADVHSWGLGWKVVEREGGGGAGSIASRQAAEGDEGLSPE